MHIALFPCAEPASVFYMVTGAISLLFARRRTSGEPADSSVTMLFCKKSTRAKLREIKLT